MKKITGLAAIAALLTGSAFAIAAPDAPGSYTGPSAKAPTAAAYTGPSSVPTMSVKELLDKGKDDQYVTVKGKLASHKGDKDYEFVDASGKMTVEISSKRFPTGQSIGADTLVELTGEFDKSHFGESTLEVKQVVVAK